MTIADRLKQLIDERGWSTRKFQELVAEEADGARGTSYASVYDYVEGRGEPPLSFLRAAARVLEVPEAWLTFGALAVASPGTPSAEGEAGRRHPLAWSYESVVRRLNGLLESNGFTDRVSAARALSRTLSSNVDHATKTTTPQWLEQEILAFLEGEEEPPLTFLMDVAVRFQVPKGWLIAGEGSPADHLYAHEGSDQIFRAEMPFYDELSRSTREVLKSAVPGLHVASLPDDEPIPTDEWKEVCRTISRSVVAELEAFDFDWKRIPKRNLDTWLRLRGEALRQLALADGERPKYRRQEEGS